MQHLFQANSLAKNFILISYTIEIVCSCYKQHASAGFAFSLIDSNEPAVTLRRNLKHALLLVLARGGGAVLARGDATVT
jgi:hypothetical protein